MDNPYPVVHEDPPHKWKVTFGSHWARVWCRVGQVAGDEIMDDCWKQGLHNDPTRSWQGLYGWAMRDPAAASEWLESLATADPGQHKRLLTAVVGGITLMSPLDWFDTHRDAPFYRAGVEEYARLLAAGGELRAAEHWRESLDP